MQIDYANESNYCSVMELYKIKLGYRQIKYTKRYANQFPLGFAMNTEVRISGRPGIDDLGMDIFQYNFPDNVRECYSFGFDWHVPAVLSIFKDVGLILKLLTALFALFALFLAS